MKTLSALLAVLVLSVVPVSAQTHPCDAAPTGPFVVKTGQAPLVGWCHPGASGFTLAADGAVAVDVMPAATGPNAAGLKYYEVRWSAGFQKGAHTFMATPYNLDPNFGGRVAGSPLSIPFAADDPVLAPVVPSRGRVLP